MKVLVLEKTGEHPQLRDLPRPALRPAHVLVRIAAAGVNPLDVKIRDGAAAHAQVAQVALVDRAGVRAGQSVLVHGGAGGVGHVAVQIALSRGAFVVATGSGRSLEVIRGLGAEPIYRTVPAPPAEPGYDVIVDTVGGRVPDEAFASLRRYTGHVVSILGWGSRSLAPLSFRGATYSGVFTLLPLLTGEGRATTARSCRWPPDWWTPAP